MTRQKTTKLGGRRFSYVDHEGPGIPLVALHGTFGRGTTFARVARALAPQYRLIALDQRGHGHSEGEGDFGRDAFVGDAAAFVRQLDVGPVFVLGHSLGGVTTYQLAARHPELVRAFVVEDVGAVTDASELEHPTIDILDWPRSTASRAELAAFLDGLGVPAPDYFMESAVERDGRWRMLYTYEDMMAAQYGNVGVWWTDWTGSSAPALLLRAGRGMLLGESLAARMLERRPHTDLVVFPECGHWIHRDDPSGYADAVRTFLERH